MVFQDLPSETPVSYTHLDVYKRQVLHDVAVGAPVFLTKNGRGRYAILDMQDFEKTQATLRLKMCIRDRYEDNVNGKISDERFMELSADYEAEIGRAHV